MEAVTDFSNVNLKDNQVIVNGDSSSLMNGAKVVFNGSGNILYVEDGVRLAGGSISFTGKNSLVYLSKNHNSYIVNLSVNGDTAMYFGRGTYFNGRLTAITSERQNIIVGDDGLFSFGVFIRTADPHLVYDAVTKVRLNASRSVLIGDHVWLGQNVLILKGTQLGSGSILAGGSVISGKRVSSNTSYGGNPAKLIRSGVFYSGLSVHNWDEERTKEHQVLDTDQWIYSRDENSVELSLIDERIKACASAKEKLDVVKSLIVNVREKNRFAL